jgi:hypothetical protein
MMKRLQTYPGLFVLCFLALACSESRDAPSVMAPSFNVGGAPQQGSGTGMITSLVITSSRTAGNNVIQTRRLEGIATGTLEGTFVEEVSGVIHGNGLVTFHGTLEFTGTLAECGSGTITGTLSGTGRAGLPITESRFSVTNQASNTLRATGTGTMSQVGAVVTYEIRYKCY